MRRAAVSLRLSLVSLSPPGAHDDDAPSLSHRYTSRQCLRAANTAWGRLKCRAVRKTHKDASKNEASWTRELRRSHRDPGPRGLERRKAPETLQLDPVQLCSKGPEMINFLSHLFSSWMQISIFQDEASAYPNKLAIQFRWQARIRKINGLNKEGKNEPVTSSQLIKLSCRGS